MSILYDQYLTQHKANVWKGFEWIRDNIPDLVRDDTDYEHQILFSHDSSKSEQDEYNAYDHYFYGNNKSFSVVKSFREAWLRHIHRNPHHWQYWILINDDPNEGEICIDIPHNYIIEMVCDWWAFSWKSGNLYEIFNWYDEHKDYIKFSKNTRREVESLLEQIKNKLTEVPS